MVIMLDAQCAETPVGNPLAPEVPSFEIPVAPVVVWAMAVSTELIQSVGVDEAVPAVLDEIIVKFPLLFKLPVVPSSVTLIRYKFPFVVLVGIVEVIFPLPDLAETDNIPIEIGVVKFPFWSDNSAVKVFELLPG